MEESIKKHFAYIDAMKGFAILLVVIGHAIAWSFRNFDSVGAQDNSWTVLFYWRLIYSFHMPLFFMISGFLFPKRSINLAEVVKVLNRKAKTLVLPYIFAGMFLYIVTSNADSYWFLKTLFFFSAINLVYELLRSQYNLNFIYDLLFYGLVYVIIRLIDKFDSTIWLDNVIDFSHFGSNYFPFCFGILLRRYSILEKFVISAKMFTPLLLIFITLFVCSIYEINFNKLFPITSAMRVISVSCLVFYLFKYIYTEGWGVKVFSLFGRYSLEIYIVHFYFAIHFYGLGDKIIEVAKHSSTFLIFGYVNLQLIVSIALSVLVTFVCIGIASILKQSKLISQLFLGR